MKLFVSCMLMLLALSTQSAVAGPGHDHGDAAPAASGAPTSPRFEAHSDLFEIVGVVNGSRMSLTIDRFATNEPVPNAKVELESGTFKGLGKFNAEQADYDFEGLAFNKPGTYPISLTITAGDEVDILAGNLVIPDPEAGHAQSKESMPTWWIWAAAGAVLAGIAFVFFLSRRRRTAPYGV
jgi:hypothetical protein